MKSKFEQGLRILKSSYNPANIVKSHPLSSLAQELIIRGLSKRTIKLYLSYNMQFLQYLGKSAKEVTSQDIKDYLLYLKFKNYSNTSLNLVISALKFYYTQVLKRKLFFNISRPKREKYLPNILSKSEIISLINLTGNLKHKLILSLMYGSGLRVSEVVKLKLRHFDLINREVLVKAGKGNKDRYTILSNYSINLFKKYIEILPNNQIYLFTGLKLNSHLSQRSAQKIFVQALNKAHIVKKVSCHSLRHSFATHLLESGVEMRLIQKLLGHTNIKTTQTYVRVAKSYLNSIKSPLD
ncbi:MAG: integrase [Candidatus Komeilibacteria bacterium CG_4_9_14_0_8_um_filter_36_9]|uniref:Integrase n=2 Tax=Candidatus Komeiliibacteriota TaxID=1817908 RepID=A0A2M8DQ12_9BACT|nr:MAG: integrase [Candidatus Komeilibacteria bacterium CG_4_10_14_0_8_um_filter_37_78]PJC01047.1 MAG: integrase [Candidatus Komeilibacteria bacterium CG_4_9_14_0_8_um_filter_36_9]